jgi:hypothetical protein
VGYVRIQVDGVLFAPSYRMANACSLLVGISVRSDERFRQQNVSANRIGFRSVLEAGTEDDEFRSILPGWASARCGERNPRHRRAHPPGR